MYSFLVAISRCYGNVRIVRNLHEWGSNILWMYFDYLSSISIVFVNFMLVFSNLIFCTDFKFVLVLEF